MDRRRNMSKIEVAMLKAKKVVLARLHFRSAVRLAYQNYYWMEDTEGEQLGLNVTRNIQILTKKKPKGQFTLVEKAIMKVPQEKRTEEEKQLLRRKLGVMKCFRKYPAEVKKELAAITYFLEYEADRKIVRQGDDALGLYFVISGTARVLVKSYDPLIDQVVEKAAKSKEEGDIFGEVALLVGSKRTATIITNERSDFLNVNRQDFDRVLKSTVQKEWDEIKRALGMFDYFNKWDERYVLESCMLCKMRYHEEDTLILSADHGDRRYVYFVIDGSVELLECLAMQVTSFNDKLTYTLANPMEGDQVGGRKDLGKQQSCSTSETEKFKTVHSRPVSADTIGFQDHVSGSTLKVTDSMWKVTRTRPSKFMRPYQNAGYPVDLSTLSPAERVSCVKQFESRRSRVTSVKEEPVITVETYFIRVARMGVLSTFNIGEHLDSRYFVASSNVKLLAIPRYWLLSRDKPLWNNLLILLKTRLPSRMQLYEMFVKNRKWAEYRKECYFDIAGRSQKSNVNCINNVPLSLRLKEDVEFFVCRKEIPSRRSSDSSDRNNKQDCGGASGACAR